MLQKISSLTCKCVFHRPKHVKRRPPMEWNFEGLDTKNEVFVTF